MQLPTCQGRIVSLWVQAIKSKGGRRESASIQYANHREEEPRCAAAEGTCCIYSSLILHWPPHTDRWAPAVTTSIRNHPVRDDLEWNHCISGSPAVSLHLVISALNKKRGQQDPANVLPNIGCISAARKVCFFFPSMEMWRTDVFLFTSHDSFCPASLFLEILLWNRTDTIRKQKHNVVLVHSNSTFSHTFFFFFSSGMKDKL